MTQVWQDDKQVAITQVQAGPCPVIQVKTKEIDGYQAVQIGYGERKAKNINKPQIGHLKKALVEEPKKTGWHHLREFRIDEGITLKPGDVIRANVFVPGDKIQVTGVSKGKGFQGVVKRHGFKGTKATHGNKDQLRMPGSIGATGPAHVFKGQRMPGHMGNERTSVTNLEIIAVDAEKNILAIKGAIPGARNGLILIKGEGEMNLEVETKKAETEILAEKESSSAKATEDKDKKDKE